MDATERGTGEAGSVWGVHDYVPNYKVVTGLDGGVTRLDPAAPSMTGCSWYRVVMPLAELARHGWRTAWRAGAPPQGAADEYRVITAQRLDKPKVLPLWRNLRLRHRLVYETDDDIFSVPPERWQQASYPQQVMWDVVETAARTSDIVTVSAEPLAEIYRKRVRCADVRVIPNSVPGALLTMNRDAHRRKVIVGWQGGGSHGPDISLIAEPLASVMKEAGKRAEIHLMGSNFADMIGHPCRFTEWITADENLDYYRAIDFGIGLAPLRGTRFDVSKTPIKALEYFALGIPVLASDVTPYRGVVIDGVNGYLCRTAKDWRNRLRDLINDPAQRAELGAKARETAREHTIERTWPQWASVYASLQ